MRNIYHSFLHSARWNACESIVYQGILLAHQSALFKVMPRAEYGMMGVIFSVVYLWITVSNIGLNDSFATWWHEAKKNKNAFIKLIAHQSMFNVALTIASLAGAYIFMQHISVLNFCAQLDTQLLLCLGAIICSESIKKTCKSVLYLLFFNRYITCVEIIMVTAYIGAVWFTYTYTHAMSLYAIFLPMMITSLVNVLLFIGALARFYKGLPSARADNNTPLPHAWRLIRIRLYNYGNQINHLLFSGNVLVPLVAFHSGFAHAGMLKFLSNITYSITTIFHKVFGLSSNAIFANTKHADPEEKRSLFTFITHYMHQLLYAVLIFLLVNYTKLSPNNLESTDIGIYILPLALLVLLSENFFIAYEKFFIAQEKSHYVMILNSGSFAAMYATLMYTQHASLTAILIGILTIRIAVLALLNFFAHKIWRLKSAWQCKPLYGMGALVVALLFFFIWQ